MAASAALSLLLLLLLLDLPFSGGFSRLGTSGGPAAAVVAAPTAFPRLSAVAAWPEEMPDGGEIRSQEALAEISSRRRVLLRGIALWAAGSTYGPRAGASAYMVQKEEPDEKRADLVELPEAASPAGFEEVEGVANALLLSSGCGAAPGDASGIFVAAMGLSQPVARPPKNVSVNSNRGSSACGRIAKLMLRRLCLMASVAS